MKYIFLAFLISLSFVNSVTAASKDKDDTYIPPDRGHPDSSHGSGTR